MILLFGMPDCMAQPFREGDRKMTNSNKNQERKVVCEDNVCLLIKQDDSTAEGSSAWLDVFCPQYNCEFTSPTQLP
jgi:hypothetical protein